MDTYNICLYKEVDKKYTGSNQKTTCMKDLDSALIGVCTVIRSNTVCFCGQIRKLVIWIPYPELWIVFCFFLS